MTTVITKQNFDTEVLNSDKPFLVDFWAAWCGPCRLVIPAVEKLAEHYQGRLNVGMVNVDEEQDLATRYHVMSIPTLLLFKDGEIADRQVGAKSFEELVRLIDKFL
ncbi:MAG: thioredoxin [Saccharofermentanales bacterium]|mgnify:CR=1 FL=1|jgi:thioredoxin 1